MGCCGWCDDPDRPECVCFPACTSEDCFNAGSSNVKQTKKWCACPCKYLQFSAAHCAVCWSSTWTFHEGEERAARENAESNAKAKHILAKRDLCCGSSDCGCFCCPFTLVGSVLGIAGGIMNVLCSIGCCITGCGLKCCECCCGKGKCCCGGKNTVAPSE